MDMINKADPSAHTQDDYEEGGNALEICEATMGDCENGGSSINFLFEEAPSVNSRSKRNRRPTQIMVQHTCRLCQHSSAVKLVQIFGTQGKLLKLADKIHFHLPISVRKSDKLPLGVCVSCVKALKTCDELYHTSLRTDSHLREVFLKGNSSTFSVSKNDNFDLEKRTKKLVEAIREIGQNTSLTMEETDTTLNKAGKKPEKSPSSSVNEVVTSSSKLSANQKTEDSDNDVGRTEHVTVEPEDYLEGHDSNESEDDSSKLEDNVDDKQNKCNLCQEFFLSHKELLRHRKTHSIEERLKCEVCGKVCANDQSFYSHVKIHSATPSQCEICKKYFSTKGGLRHHMVIHEEPQFCCQICGKRARSRQKLEDHMVSHSDERPYKCHLCDQSFKRILTLRQHELVHSDTPRLICDICGRAFRRKCHLDRHTETHNKGSTSKWKSALTCSVCFLSYTHELSLLRHMKAAHGEEDASNVQVVCEVCGEEQPGKLACLEHKIRVHKMKTMVYKCTHCDVILKSKRSLDIHVRGHTGERPFLCKICGATFKSEASRNGHETKHSDERPHKCTICDKAFRRYGTLCQHRILHAERKLKCNLCPYKTHRPAGLRAHLRSHSAERPFSCIICGKSYKHVYDLKLHGAVHRGEHIPRRIRPKTKKPRLKEAVDDDAPDTEESSNSTLFQEATLLSL